jgi:hypothetical protein
MRLMWCGGVGSNKGRRPLPAVRDLTRDGRWSTYNVSVLKKMGGKIRTDRTPSKATVTNKTPASQAGRLAGPVFYVYVFSLGLDVSKDWVTPRYPKRSEFVHLTK